MKYLIISLLFSHFDEIFAQAPIEEKKLLIRLCISGILVDRDNNVVRFSVRKVPIIHPQIEELYKNKKALTEEIETVVSA